MMNERRSGIQFFGPPALAAALLALALAAGCAPSAPPRGPWHDWTRLRLDVEALPLLSGEVEMLRESAGSSTVLRTTSTARLLGATIAEARTRSEIDAGTGRCESHESVSAGRGRRYLFGESGYTVERRSAPDDVEAPFDDWPVDSRREFPYPVDERGHAVAVHDYYAMILYLGRLDLDEVGDEATLHVATADGVVGYVVSVVETRPSTRSLGDPARGPVRTLELTELRLRIRPADPERASEGFLRMEGETAIWVERATKTLVEIDGKVPRVPGDVRLVLTEMS